MNNRDRNHLEEIISDSNLFILNTGCPTRVSRSHQRASVPMFLCTAHLITNYLWQLIHDTRFSDHFQISFLDPSPKLIDINTIKSINRVSKFTIIINSHSKEL